MLKTENLLLTGGDVEISAAGKPPEITILAYTGGLMSVPGWGRVLIDLNGLDLSSPQVSILADHDSTLKGVVGHGRAEVRDGKLIVAGTIAPTTDAAKQIIALAKTGFSFQASVGREEFGQGARAQAHKSENEPDGRSGARVNSAERTDDLQSDGRGNGEAETLAIPRRQRYYTAKSPKNHIPGEHCFCVRKEHLEDFVLGKIAEILNQPHLRERLQKAVAKKLKGRKKKPVNRSTLRKRLADLDGKITRATKRLLLVDAEALHEANRILAGWRNERHKLADEIERLAVAENGNPEAEVDNIMARLADLKETIGEADPMKLKAALKATVESITIYWGPGGSRKWQLKRGIIRFRESLLVALPCTSNRSPASMNSRDTWLLLTPTVSAICGSTSS